MADKAQLVAQIRFALEQLSERNAQHEWEHLTRHFARERICANILPATGPVQAGGDQGRDFETFRTYLQASSLQKRSFVGLVSDRPLAFACSLEKSVGSKVRRDVITIMASGTPVEGIYFFSSRGLDVAKRHELQKWCMDTHSVTLEVFDGEAMAEHLSDPDLYWLAERYLQMPSELAPMPAPNEPKDWYSVRLAKWRSRDTPARTFADFSELRGAARHARGEFRFAEDGSPTNSYDLPEFPFWLERLDEIAGLSDFPMLSRRALYEVSVLRLRGLGDLHGQEGSLRAFFSGIPGLEDPAELEDVEVLLTYLLPAQERGLIAISVDELSAWMKQLSDHLNRRISKAKKEDRKNELCALLETRAHVAMFADYHQGIANVGGAFLYWNQLMKYAEQAPMFPLERFADRLTAYARYIGAYDEYEALTQAVDVLLGKRVGQAKAAEKCLQRARSFAEGGDLTHAMAQLHQAKVDWYAEETLRESLTAMRMLSSAYLDQGLHFASKQYSLAVAYLVINSSDLELKSMMAPAILEAALCDYVVGAWHGCLELYKALVAVYPHFAVDPDEDFNSETGVLHRFIFHLVMIVTLTNILHPALNGFVQEATTPLAERFGDKEELLKVEEEYKASYREKPLADVWESVRNQLAGPPWSDAGDMRRVQWSAHGVAWYVTWNNDYETNMVAEEFLAGLQVFLSDLDGYDLCLMRSTINLTLVVADGPTSQRAKSGEKYFQARFQPSNADRQAVVTLPPYAVILGGEISRDDILSGTIVAISALLADVSLLPSKRFLEVIGERFSKGLRHKILIAAPYSRCLSAFVSKEDFVASSRTSHPSLTLPFSFPPEQTDCLRWYDGPGPGYTQAKGREMTENRYKRFSLPLSITINRLSKDKGFRETIQKLRGDGWKDWHILAMAYNITMGHRMNLLHPTPPKTAAEVKAYMRVEQRPERETDVQIPIEYYSEKVFRDQIRLYMLSYLGTFSTHGDIELHQSTPDFTAIEDFLAIRYNFWTDDVEHEDPFLSPT